MISAVHGEHAAVVAIANRLFERDPAAWMALLARARAERVTLLALVYGRLREVRDSVAREAFERRIDERVVAREWLEAARNGQGILRIPAKCAESLNRKYVLDGSVESGART